MKEESIKMGYYFSSGLCLVFCLLLLNGCATKLQAAAAHGATQEVMELLNEGASISERGPRGWTALHYASYSGYINIVDLLLGKGAEIDARGEAGETPLYLASHLCHEKVVNRLLKNGANVRLQVKYNDESRWSPLLIASEEGCGPKIIKDLLSAGGDANGTPRPNGYTPIMYAAMIGTFHPIEVLLDAGAIVNYQAYDGVTALMVAASNGSKEVARVLLSAGANTTIKMSQARGPFHKLFEPTDTALSIARRKGHDEIVELLEAAE